MEDAAIIALMEKRDETALEELGATYGRALRTLANNLLHDEAATEECVNDTLLKVWNAIPPASPQRLSAYVYQICRRTALERLARERKHTASVTALTDELAACLPDPQSDASIRSGELGEQINAFLKTLSDDNRRIFLRRYWYADPVADIARRYRMSESKVKTSLCRTRKALGAHLRKEGWTL